MKLSNIANVIDLEFDGSRVLEIGLTTIDLTNRSIIKSYSFPIKVEEDYEVDKEIIDLTGWTAKKLNRQGFTYSQIEGILHKHGFANRLLIADCSDEANRLISLTPISIHQVNICLMYCLKFGFEEVSLESMLKTYNMKFEGVPHSGKDDSYNIARVFLELVSNESPLDKYMKASQELGYGGY